MSHPELLLGPIVRYADETAATLWMKVSAPAEVEVLGRRTRTFEVEGHHYALVIVEGLPPGTDTPYSASLDGRQVWPRPDDPRPRPRLRTLRPGAPVDIAFGSCRVDRPHEEPWTCEPNVDPAGVGVDALQALALTCQRGERALPDLILMLGDQVYADEGLSPVIRERQIARRGADTEPRNGVADFEEYTWLYQDSWQAPEVRWLLSTVPSVMIFDDHDVRDDWNTSQTWRHQVQQLPWWRKRITGAHMSYWLYQHAGNVSPATLREEGLLQRLQESTDGGGALRTFAEQADDEVAGRKCSRWSYVRELGDTRLVVVDSRSGRVLEDGKRSMLSEPEWEQVEQWLRGDCDHLLVATSLPLLLERALHDLEGWNEQVCGGRWGRRAARYGEIVRQAIDLEHWAAFRRSFDRMVHCLGEVAAGRRGRAPSTVVVLSGDVHHSYVAPLHYPTSTGVESTVVQVVSSPLRNAFPRRLQRAFRLAHTGVARLVGRALTRSVGLPAPEVDWTMTTGPIYGNALASLRLEGTAAHLSIHRAVRSGDSSHLEAVYRERLDQRRDRPAAGRRGRNARWRRMVSTRHDRLATRRSGNMHAEKHLTQTRTHHEHVEGIDMGLLSGLMKAGLAKKAFTEARKPHNQRKIKSLLSSVSGGSKKQTRRR